jgi:nitroimidazol reductase NimA-like FMN-containing flavoprotein (pyridoxamine 5'-phosphate oxidase superfamily)
MRRTDYETTDDREVQRLLAEAEHGFLGITTPDGWPSAIPVNFVYLKGQIYFHGATEGEKMASLGVDPRVTFTIVRDLSIVPSYFRHRRLACPATQYYQSVMIRGRARFVATVEEKARVLQALMEKLQPEGGYEPITARAPLYRKSLETTSVTAIEIVRVTGKFKLGQNLPRRKRRVVADRLEQRGEPVDIVTAELMRVRCVRTEPEKKER